MGQMVHGRSGLGVVVIGDKLFAVGGHRDAVESLDLSLTNSTWSLVDTMIAHRGLENGAACHVVAIKGVLYILDGVIQRYDPNNEGHGTQQTELWYGGRFLHGAGVVAL